MRELIEEARRKIRKLSHELRPATLDELGLVPTLRRLVDDFGGEAGLAALFDSALTEGLAPQIETACYRIVQEALTNVVRHAQAKHLWVGLEAEDGYLHLKVEDDGRGFDPRQAQSKGVGLLGIRERVMGLNGEFIIHSTPGQGTRLEVKFADNSA
jgi:signal transduction histidine kinase